MGAIVMRHLIAIAAVLAAILTPLSLAARIYIWTDAEGVKHFSQEPPPEHATEVMVQDEMRYDPSADAKSHRAQDADTGEARPAAKPQQTPIVLKGNVILVPAVLSFGDQQVETRLVVDTGASMTVLNAPLAERLRIQPETNAKIKVASGDAVAAQAVILDALRVGPHTAREMRALIIRHEGPHTTHPGFLGLNFLGQYPYSIDMRKMVIHWGGHIPPMGP